METLTAKIKAMAKMKRGSDLLQNLVWIVLATSTWGTAEVDGDGEQQQGEKEKGGMQCLFMSSGKDTSRMIRFCKEKCGDEETGAKLDQFRDVVKAGNDTEQHRAEMRRMAETAVQTTR